MRRLRVTAWFCVLLLVAIVALLYGRTLGFGYVWDDSLLFLDRAALMNDPLSWALLSEPVLPGTSYLRPLVFLSLYAEFHLFGQSPQVSHAVNLALLACNVLLVFAVGRRLASRLGRNELNVPALLAALLYVAHPALVESTAWISGRFDLLVTTFILLASWVYLGPLSGWRRAFLLMLLMIGALLSKELGFVLPAVLLCLWVACNASSDESPLRTFQRAFQDCYGWLLLLLITFAGYLFLRAHSVGEVYHYRLDLAYIQDSWWYSLLPLEALKLYVKLAFLPFHDIHPMHPLGRLEPRALPSLLVSICLLLALLALLWHAWRRRSAASWLALASLCCILPVLHLLPLSIAENLGHERFMTTALAFWALSLVFIPYERLLRFLRLPRAALHRVLGLLYVGWLVLAVWTLSSILPFWSSDLQLWNWAYKTYPEMGIVRYNYLYGALQEGRFDLVDQDIKRIREDRGGLEVGEQLLYANFLLRTGDPEGMKYMEGVMLALPKFHEMPDGKHYIDRFLMTASQMGGAYADYSMGNLVFQADPKRAEYYNSIARWYLRESEKIPLNYQLVAILYAQGKYDRAASLRGAQQGLYYHRKVEMEEIVQQLLGRYCDHKDSDISICRELRSRGVLQKK